MTAELREAMALTPWGLVKVKEEEEEEEAYGSQACSEQRRSEHGPVCAPAEGPPPGPAVSEEEDKVLKRSTCSYWFQKLRSVRKLRIPSWEQEDSREPTRQDLS